MFTANATFCISLFLLFVKKGIYKTCLYPPFEESGGLCGSHPPGKMWRIQPRRHSMLSVYYENRRSRRQDPQPQRLWVLPSASSAFCVFGLLAKTPAEGVIFCIPMYDVILQCNGFFHEHNSSDRPSSVSNIC